MGDFGGLSSLWDHSEAGSQLPAGREPGDVHHHRGHVGRGDPAGVKYE